MKISKTVLGIQPSTHRKVIAIAERKKREGKSVYNFSQGQPGLPPDAEAVSGLIERLSRQPFECSRYVETKGMGELRQAISMDLKNYGGIDVPHDQIMVTDGAVEGLNLALATLTEPNDKVALLDPCYSVYWDLLAFHDLKTTAIPQDISLGFQPSIEGIKETMASGISAMIVCSPDNPTSRILSEEAARTIVDEAVDRQITILYDEAYKHMTYEGKHLWIQNFGNAMDHVISLNSFSKDLALPGFRLGYVYGPNEVIEQMAKVKAFTSICSPTPSQYLALEYYRRGLKERYLSSALPVYRKRRDALYEAIIEHLPRAEVFKPVAGMYLFPDISPYLRDLSMNDVEFCIRMAEEAEVITVPGSASGPAGSGHLRLCFVVETEDKLKAGIERMASFIESF
jgi:aspartate aminotransferase